MVHEFDFLVLGSGIAGLSFALEASKSGTVALVTKRDIEESNTKYAQGGIATVFDRSDSFDLHIRDTLLCGDGLCKPDIVEMTVRAGPEKIKKLVDLGVSFNKMTTDARIEYDLGIEGGHSRRRVLHVEDLTGREVERILSGSVQENGNIRLFQNCMGIDLITFREKSDEGEKISCGGCYVLDAGSGRIFTVSSPITVLATGGAGKVYLYTSNSDVATGDGIAMAYRAGARIANMEFFQFHPTCLYHHKAKSFLISEALRGEGAILRRIDGTAFMGKYHAMKDLAPRDVVARAIDAEMKESGDEFALLDITHKGADFVRKRFPNIYEKCIEFGYDMTKEPIPVVPAAHYSCGGVVVDRNGETNVSNLFCVGESACTGLHGANRLASNSLLESLVFADAAALVSRERISAGLKAAARPPEWVTGMAVSPQESVVISQNWDEIRRFMWNYVGIVRSTKRLTGARKRLEILREEIKDYYWNFLPTSDLLELRNIATVAFLIIECAISRKESRGLHFNQDYPFRDDERFRQDTIMWKGVGK